MLTVVRRGGAAREKPPEVVRGYSSRLPWAWDGLCFAAPFSDATRDSARDLVGNVPPSEWVGTPSFTKDNRGNVAALMPADAYAGYANNPMHNQPTSAVTAYVRFRRTGTPPVAVGVFCKVHTPDTDPWRTWSIQATDGNALQMAASITVNGVNIYWENTGYTTDTSTWVSAFLRWTSGTAPVQDILGEHGQSYSTAAYGSTVSGSLTYNTVTPQPIRLNAGDNPPPGNPTYLGAYSQAMLWSRRLTDTEMQALVADPYGWYSPRRETIGVSSPYPLFGGTSLMIEVPSG